ncbi:hypothetical protein [Chitiniphilus shinanonensis]|uniref:hypothetical protein n=1 Tax=Chitiniphilus shinanonensis TaxID=553088 RepID=UPI00303F306B
MHSYSLDPKSARRADEQGGRIDESGKYIGVFTRVEPFTSEKGAQGVGFDFKSNSGGTASFTLYTHSKAGSPIFGLDWMNAILTVLRTKQVSVQAAPVEKYNAETKQREKVTAQCFVELMNKPIGIVLQKEWYTNQKGADAYRFSPYAIFDAETEQVASEVLDQKPADRLGRIVATLKDRDTRSKTAAPQASGHAALKGFDDFEDDIPF